MVGVKPNETIEAYTGNHVARKGDRNPPDLIQPRHGARGRKVPNADGNDVNGSEANTESA